MDGKERLGDQHLDRIIKDIWPTAAEGLKAVTGCNSAIEWLELLKSDTNAFICPEGIIYVRDIQVGKETTAYISWIVFTPRTEEEIKNFQQSYKTLYKKILEHCFNKLKVDNVQYDDTQTFTIRQNITKMNYEFALEQKKRFREVEEALASQVQTVETTENVKLEDAKLVPKSNRRARKQPSKEE